MSNFEKLFQSFNYQPKMIPHMCRWLEYYFKFAKYNKLCEGEPETLKKYTAYIERKYEPWQIQQAEEAVKIYLYANDETVKAPYSEDARTMWQELHKIGIEIIRIKHYSRATEKTYVGLGGIMSMSINFKPHSEKLKQKQKLQNLLRFILLGILLPLTS